jgi:hypothetical protein
MLVLCFQSFKYLFNCIYDLKRLMVKWLSYEYVSSIDTRT